MSSICRKCGGQMPEDRHGVDQICPKCQPKMKSLEQCIGETIVRTTEEERTRIDEIMTDEIIRKIAKRVRKWLGREGWIVKQVDGSFTFYEKVRGNITGHGIEVKRVRIIVEEQDEVA